MVLISNFFSVLFVCLFLNRNSYSVSGIVTEEAHVKCILTGLDK